MIEAQIAAVLVRRWYWIIIGAIIGGLLSAATAMSGARSFQATIDLVPNRARFEVNYDTPIRTVSGIGEEAAAAVPSSERRQALATLVRNSDIEKAVREALAGSLPAYLQRPGALLGMVQGRLAPKSEIISITVTAPTAELAEMIAAAWATAYERHVNRLYSSGSEISRSDLNAQVVEAREKYQSAEDAYTQFLASSQLAENSRLLENSQLLLLDRQALIRDLTQSLRKTELLLGDALALQNHIGTVRDSGAAATNVSALVLLKVQAFTELGSSSAGVPGTATAPQGQSSPLGAAQGAPNEGSASNGRQLSPPAQSAAPASSSSSSGIQVQVSPANLPVSLAQQRDDVSALIAALQFRREHLNAQLASLFSGGGPSGAVALGRDTASQLEQDLRERRANVADLSARESNLVHLRDLALESYRSLEKKAEEERVSRAVGSGKEVTIANLTAIASESPRVAPSRAILLGAATGGAVGAVGAIAAVFLPVLVRRILVLAETPPPVNNGHGEWSIQPTPNRKVPEGASAGRMANNSD